MNGKNFKRLILLIVLIVLAVFFRLWHLERYFTLSFLKVSRDEFALFYVRHPAAVIACYMGVYILSTALSLPGALVLTIAGGAFFGLLTGTVVVSFASTIGATLACLVSRFLLRDWVQVRFGARMGRINEGIQREGGFYLFTLRLIPVFPFWLINLAMGLTKMPIRTFYWVSQVGMLPATIVYVNAGSRLAVIHSLSEIISPGLIFSFALAGLVPITTKKLLNRIRSRKGKAEINA